MTYLDFAGDLANDTAPWANAQLVEALSNGPDLLVVDLGRLDLLTAAGVSVLARAHLRAKAGGIAVAIRRPRAEVRRVLELCGLGSLITGPTLAVGRGHDTGPEIVGAHVRRHRGVCTFPGQMASPAAHP